MRPSKGQMHEHDLDLIAALADGSLDDPSEARALVADCEVCRVEHEAQLSALDMIAAAPAATMSDMERAALHRDLWTEVTRTQARTPSAPWWHRWSYVAAGLLVVVGVGSVLGGQMQSGDQVAESFSEIASELDSGADGATPFVADDHANEEAAEAEASTTTTAASAPTLPLSFRELAEQARAEEGDRSLGTLGVDDEVAECLERVGLDDHKVVDEVEQDQTYLVVMPQDPQAEPTVTFITLADCEVVYVDR